MSTDIDSFVTLIARQQRVRDFLDRLAARPPQVLLMEGGTVAEREAMALYWAARLNCKAAGLPGQEAGRACLSCPECRQILDKVHLDLIIHDGREALITMDDVRETRIKVGQPPRGDGHRVVLFIEAQNMRPETPNVLLKTLEEPRPGNAFVLVAPQREILLQTLISRSWVLTLAWPRDPEPNDQAEEWVRALVNFRATGRGWFDRTAGKGAVDRPLASSVLLALQDALLQAMRRAPRTDSAAALAALPPQSLRRLDLVVEKALEALEMQVSPALTLDWVATQSRLC